MNISPTSPSTPFVSTIKRPTTFGLKYKTIDNHEMSQTISKIDTTMNNLPKRSVYTKTKISTNELFPLIPHKLIPLPR